MENVLLISSFLLWLLLIGNVILTVGLSRRLKAIGRSRVTKLQKGDPAPEFNATTIDGSSVTSFDYENKALALVFMSPTCQPCVEELPRLARLRNSHEFSNVEIILVSDSNANQTLPMLEISGADNLQVLIAPRNRSSFFLDYRAIVTPSFTLVDSSGKVFESGAGAEIANIESAISALSENYKEVVLQ